MSETLRSSPSIRPAGTGSLPVKDQENLFISLQDALKKAETGDSPDFEGAQDVLYKLWDCKSDYMIPATEALANGSRNPPFRLAYGQAGILSFFLQLVASQADIECNLILHSLRLIGNSCADTNENRATVVQDNYTLAILRNLHRPELTHVVIPVLYNLCVDYEPAQSQLASSQVAYILLKLVDDGAFRDNDVLLSYAYGLLELVGEQEQGIEKSPDQTLSLLISLLTNKEILLAPAEFSSIANCFVAYLENKRFQDLCITEKMVDNVLSVLRFSLTFGLGGSQDDEAKALAQSQLKLNQALAELSASPLFAETYPLDAPLSQTLKTWLATKEDQLQICACVMLGNLARSDEVCETMVRELKIHHELIAILNSDARGAVLHSAIGFLKNLAIASDNRQYLGKAGIVPAVSRLWGYEAVPQVQLAATSIARQLIISSIDNISRILEPLPTQEDGVSSKRTYLSLLLALFEKSDSTPMLTEIGRIIASICRTLVPKAREQDHEAGTLLESLFEIHQGVAHPIGAMITQTQWPVVRSEGWFALALMTSSKPGSVAAISGLQNIDGLALIEEILSAGASASDPDGADKTQPTKDRDNVIVLVQELLKHDPETLSDPWRSKLNELTSSHVSKYLEAAK